MTKQDNEQGVLFTMTQAGLRPADPFSEHLTRANPHKREVLDEHEASGAAQKQRELVLKAYLSRPDGTTDAEVAKTLNIPTSTVSARRAEINALAGDSGGYQILAIGKIRNRGRVRRSVKEWNV